MISFPDWYKGGFPDQEAVVKDLLTPFLAMCSPVPQAVAWLPDHYQEVLPIVRIYRGGGGADGLFDPAAIQLGVIAETRAESWALAEYCRQVMLSYIDGGHVRHADNSATTIQSIAEMVGPQLLPELNPDDRLVPVTFRVECRRPRGLPDYARVRESLAL